MNLWRFRWPVFALLLVVVTLAACGSDSATPANTGASTLTTGSPSPTAPATSAVADAPASPDTPSTPTAAPGGATGTPAEAGADTDAGADRATALYFVQTITCPGCAKRVEASAREDPGVIEVEVDLSTRNVSVTYDPTVTDPEQIAEAIRAGGDIVVPQSSE